jgi:hypothetical protein
VRRALARRKPAAAVDRRGLIDPRRPHPLGSSPRSLAHTDRFCSRELHHIPVRVGDVQRPLAPRPVGRRSEHTDAHRSQPRVLGVDVLDEERDPALRPRRRIRGCVATNQRRQLAAREERELCTFGRELRVGVGANSQRQANDIAGERDRSIEIAHEQDRVAKTGRHANMFAPQLRDALAEELVAAPRSPPVNSKRVALPSERASSRGSCS